MVPFMFGILEAGICTLFYADKPVFKFRINMAALNDTCVGVLRGVTDMEEAVIELLYVQDAKVRFKFAVVKHYAWFVPICKVTPAVAYAAAAKAAAGDQWVLIDISRPSYKWERKQN